MYKIANILCCMLWLDEPHIISEYNVYTDIFYFALEYRNMNDIIKHKKTLAIR